MDPKEVRDLIELISRSSFRVFVLEREGFRLKLVKSEDGWRQVEPPILEPQAVPQRREAAPLASDEPPEASAPADGLVELKSPIVGTFYRSPGPDAALFVDVGSRVEKGQVLCIVEAMKVMNEIESEIAAEVAEIPVTNAQPVEFGEVLFRLRPL